MHYALVKTSGAPTLAINGIRMHRTKDITPLEDAASKINLLKIRRGFVLDTCCGLGYSAIEASKFADNVITFEKNPHVIEIAKQNEYSRKLFEKNNIRLINGDIYEEIKKFDSKLFDYVIHDPPRLALAGELYGRIFYDELYRVIKAGGKMFHYIGSPGSRYRHKNIKKGVMRRLNDAGFKSVSADEAQGVIGIKV